MSSSSFDFNSQSGIADILLRVRQSDLSDEAKSDLRDQIFTYVRSGGDQTMRSSLEAALNALAKPVTAVTKSPNDPDISQTKSVLQSTSQPTAVSPKPQTVSLNNSPHTSSVPKLGMARIRPTFKKINSDQTDSAPEITESADTESVPKKAIPNTINRSPAAPPPADLPVVPEAKPVSLDEITPQSKPAQTTEAAPLDSAEEVTTNVDPLTRIKEIKAEVNAVVGNPVHLMADDNPVGKEYMSTLLAAIKAVNGQNTAEISQIMERLEMLRQDVLTAAQESSHTSTVDSVKSSMASDAPTDQNIKTPDPIADSSSKAQTAAAPRMQTPPLTQKSATPVVEGNTVAETVAAAPLQSVTAPPTPPVSPAPVDPTSTKPEPPGSEARRSLKAKLFGAPEAKKPVTMTPVPPRPESVADTTELASAAEQLADRQAELAAKVAAAPKPTTQPESADPLERPEVTAGLSQLLSEWKLFKSSGIFGTGPSGTDHPLYKQLADLPMAAIVSGRFEGATNEVRQSIGDYMNGWRYEQGVVHDNDETFEHYLRRIISHILDKAEA